MNAFLGIGNLSSHFSPGFFSVDKKGGLSIRADRVFARDEKFTGMADSICTLRDL